MNEHISFQANPETRGTVPVQFFEAEVGATAAVPAGTKAMARPADKPRELPPAGPVLDVLRVFESEGPGEPQGTGATPRPTGRPDLPNAEP